jgi:hypothetical protein
MNTHNAIIATPTPVPFYEQEILPMHLDGVFFALLCLASWILFIFIWAWNHKPRRKSHQTIVAKGGVADAGQVELAL